MTPYVYTILRVVPDPIREEFANIGVAMVNDEGSFSRLRYNFRIQTRLTALGGRKLIQPILDELGAMAASYDVSGVHDPNDLGLLKPMTRSDLQDWAQSRGGIVRMTRPRVTLAEDPDSAFESVYSRFVRSASWSGQHRAVSPEAERANLRDRFVRTLSRLPNFDPQRVRIGAAVRGVTRHHWLDVSVVGRGVATAFAHAIPMAATDDRHIFTNRSLILEAAGDWQPDGLKIALYNEPDADRSQLLTETSSALSNAGVVLATASQLQSVANTFDEPLLAAAQS